MRANGALLAMLTMTSVMDGSAEAARGQRPVSFVGCPSDGQLGQEPPPKHAKVPLLPAQVASRLAFYQAARGPGVLAPKGWHCFGLYGSNGDSLLVTPERHSFSDLTRSDGGSIKGFAVTISHQFGGTSGRWAVAAAIARFFPARREFIRSIEDMGLAVGPLPSSHDRNDVIEYRTSDFVRYTTRARRKGWGTRWQLQPNNVAVEGIVALIPRRDGPDLLEAKTRLPANLQRLTPIILSQAKSSVGN